MAKKQETEKDGEKKRLEENLARVVKKITVAGADSVSVKIQTPDGKYKEFRVARKPTFKKVAA